MEVFSSKSLRKDNQQQQNRHFCI